MRRAHRLLDPRRGAKNLFDIVGRLGVCGAWDCQRVPEQ